MDEAGILVRGLLRTQRLSSLDHAEPVDQMCAVDLAMQQYFGSVDWLKVRNKEFPGLQRRNR